MPKIKYVNR